MTLKFVIGRNNNRHSLVYGVTISNNKCICSQTPPVTISELGSSDHNMVLLKPNGKKYVEIDDKQFGGISGTSTRDVLVELVHMWYNATDKLNSYIRVVMLDFSKAFDLIHHHLLLDKLQS